MTCTAPRCNEPSVGDTPARWWAQCVTHAVEYADRDLARAQAARDSLRPFESNQQENAMPADDVVYVQPVCDGKWGWECPCGMHEQINRETKREPFATWRKRALMRAAEHGQMKHPGQWALGPDRITVNSLSTKDLERSKKPETAA